MRSHLRPHAPRGHPRPYRPAALAGGAAALTAALLATGCDASSSAEASAHAPEFSSFSSVRFTLDSRGAIEISGGSRTAVRSVGAYPVTAGRAYRFSRPDGHLLVVLRHWPQAGPDRASRGRTPRLMPPPEGSAVETGFLVDTPNRVLADLDGHPLQWLDRDTIRVDTTNTAAGDLVRLTLSGPHGGRPGPATTPSADRTCAHVDNGTTRQVLLPEVETGTPVADARAKLRRLCLDVQYASRPGGARPGTVRQVLIPLAGRWIASAELPPLDGAALPGRAPGNRALVDPSRPATVVVTR
ncbi:hypothetical protein [Streptomyces sp. NBC_00989]|uniref:hypothetical protein n=1 Tax=Streptomyces sp. NBC_00989 TaxID=2903705 RepID=UPI0038688D1A|nr:hypothetical protein OG714_36310 [Streptomyces sp. NBC_00989]